MTSAAVTSLCSSAVIALLSCNGDIGKAAHQMVSGDTLKSIGISMLTAGITEGVSSTISTTAGSWGNFAKNAAIGVGAKGIGMLTEGHVHLSRRSADCIKIGAALLGLVTKQDPNVFAAIAGAEVYHQEIETSKALKAVEDAQKLETETPAAGTPLSTEDQRSIDDVMRGYVGDDADRATKHAHAEKMYAYLKDHLPAEHLPHVFETLAKQGIVNQPQLASMGDAIPAMGVTAVTLAELVLLALPVVIAGALFVGGVAAIDYLSDRIAEAYGTEVRNFIDNAFSKQSSGGRSFPTPMPNTSTPGSPDPGDGQGRKETQEERAARVRNHTHTTSRMDQIEAAKLGFTQKIPANRLPIDSKGKPAFRNPDTGYYITRDRTGHNIRKGWEVLDRLGKDRNRIGTYDKSLHRVKD